MCVTLGITGILSDCLVFGFASTFTAGGFWFCFHFYRRGPPGPQRSGGQRRPPLGSVQTYLPNWLPVVLAVVCFHGGSCGSVTNRYSLFVFWALLASNLAVRASTY